MIALSVNVTSHETMFDKKTNTNKTRDTEYMVNLCLNISLVPGGCVYHQKQCF